MRAGRHSSALLAYATRQSDWSIDACSSAHPASRRDDRLTKAVMTSGSSDSKRRWSWAKCKKVKGQR